VALRSAPDAGPIDILSICTGGGGLDIGVQLAIPIARSVCLVEREAFAIAHLVSAMQQGLLHDAPVWSDAGTFDGCAWRGFVDGLIGGIPCQPHSLAGQKRGSLDERDLWSDARRIIVQSRVWFVLIENVAGMLSAGADEIAGAERVWRDLQRLGFAVEGGLFSAAEVGAPHQRERLFILAIHDGLANASGAGWQGSEREGASAGWDRPETSKSAAEFRGAFVEHADCARRAQAGAGPAFDAGQQSEPGCGALVYAERAERRPDAGARYEPDRNDGGRDQAAGRAGEPGAAMADADIAELRRQPSAWQFEIDERDAASGLFPPGPDDFAAWAAIAEHDPDRLPALSRHDRFSLAIREARAVVDGDTGGGERLDEKGPYGLRASVVQALAQSHLRRRSDGVATARTEWLRLLGNGVVPLAAAYAIRTLATRLAARGSSGAGRLVRMMEAQHGSDCLSGRDCGTAIVRRPAGAPASEACETEREAKP